MPAWHFLLSIWYLQGMFGLESRRACSREAMLRGGQGMSPSSLFPAPAVCMAPCHAALLEHCWLTFHLTVLLFPSPSATRAATAGAMTRPTPALAPVERIAQGDIARQVALASLGCFTEASPLHQCWKGRPRRCHIRAVHFRLIAPI